MVTTKDEWLRPADLWWSEPTTRNAQQKTTSSRRTRSDIIWFDVFKSVKDEEEEAAKSLNDEVRELLKSRANNRLAIRKSATSATSESQKNRRTSTLVDLWVQMLNDKWVSSWDLQQYLKDPKKWMELVDNIKSIDNGKYSWEIDNYINWLSPDDWTWLFVKIFPDYAEKFWYWTPKQENKVQQVLQWWEETMWSKIWWWTRNTALGRTVKSLATNASNLVLWAANDLVEMTLWLWDIANSVVKWLALQSPESYLKQLASSQWKERYDEVVRAWKYKWSYQDRVQEAYDRYTDVYDKTMQEEWFQEKYKNWRDWLWYDENAWGTQVWEFGTDVGTFFAWDWVVKKWLNYANKLYKGYKLSKWAKLLKWAEEIWATDMVKAQEAWDIFKALSSKTEREAAWNMFDKLSEAFSQSLAEWWTPTTLSRALEWARMWTEMQWIEDIKEWELSKPQAYAYSALANSIFNVVLWSASDVFWKLVEPSDLVKTSASRIPWQQIDQYTTMAKNAAKEPRAEHPLAYVYNKATNVVKNKIKWALDSAWAKLWQIRKNLPQTDLQMSDAIWEINKWFENNKMWVRIVWNPTEWYSLEWTAASSEKALWWIINKLNSMLSELTFRIKEWWKLPTNTEYFENFYTALKRIWWTAEKTDKPMFEEIEKSIRKYLDDAIWPKEAKKYADALAENAELYGIQDVVPEIEWKLKALNTPEWWGWARLSNWMSLTEYADLLEKYWFVKNLLEQREIAAYLQAYYKVPITVWDRAAYPSLAWLMERGQTWLQRIFSSPEWSNFLRLITPTSETLWRPLSARWKWYVETRGQKIYWTIWDTIWQTLKWKAATTISEWLD